MTVMMMMMVMMVMPPRAREPQMQMRGNAFYHIQARALSLSLILILSVLLCILLVLVCHFCCALCQRYVCVNGEAARMMCSERKTRAHATAAVRFDLFMLPRRVLPSNSMLGCELRVRCARTAPR